VKDCLQPMDIRTMGRDEADFLMGHISARMDEMNLASAEDSDHEAEDQNDVKTAEEDFHSRSKK